MDILFLSSVYTNLEKEIFKGGGVNKFLENLAKAILKKNNVKIVLPSSQTKKLIWEGMEIYLFKSLIVGRERGIPLEMGKILELADDMDVFVMVDPLPFFFSKFKTKSKKVGIVHGIALHGFWRRIRDNGLVTLLTVGEPLYFKLFCKNFDLICAVSPVSANFLKKFGIRNIFIIGNGIDTKRYEFSFKKEDIAVKISRLASYKGITEEIKAFSELGYNFVILGEGRLKEYVKKVTKTFPNIKYEGYVPEERKIYILKQAKYLISLSYLEAFGITLIEGMACGCVPIVRDIPAHRWVFQGEKVGLLVKNWKELISALEWLENNPEERKKMSKRGRKLVEKVWNIKRIANNFISKVESVLQG